MATTNEEEDDDDKDGPALSKERVISNPGGERTIAVEANDNSKNARVTQEQDTTHKVDPDKDDDKDVPAHLSVRTVERGEDSETTEQLSADQSSGAANKQKQTLQMLSNLSK
jgi:hypothetical protein